MQKASTKIKTACKASREWRVEKMCGNCPFHTSGPGLHLRKSLRPGRWRGILKGLREGQIFECHKTVHHDEDDEEYTRAGTGLFCAGALAYLKQRGISNQYVRICERLDIMYPTNQPGEHHEADSCPRTS